MRRHLLAAAASTIAFTVLCAACDWRPFENVRDQAPAQILTAPSNVPAGEFGGSLAEIAPPPSGTSAELVVLGNNHPGFATFTFDAHGHASSAGKAAGDMQAPFGDAGASFGAIAAVSGQRIVASAITSQGIPELLVFDPSTFTPASLQLKVPVTTKTPELDFGGSLAAGDLDGDGKEEWAVTSDETLSVFHDEGVPATPAQCVLPTTVDPTSHLHGLAIGKLDGKPGAELAIGVPGDAVGGSVWILRYASDLSPASGYGCTAVGEKVTAPDGAADTSFGVAVALGHVRSRSRLDLIVGAPGENKVFVFANDGTGHFGGPVETLTPQDLADAGAFGSSVEAIALAKGTAPTPDAGRLVDMGSALETGTLREMGARLEAGPVPDMGAPLEAGPVPDMGAPLEAGATPDMGAPRETGPIADMGAPPDMARPSDAASIPAGPDLTDIAVGDPKASVNGTRNAGRIGVFASGKQVADLYDRNPTLSAELGLTLGRLDFLPAAGGPPAQILVVGGLASVYVYFQTGAPGETDPRQ